MLSIIEKFYKNLIMILLVTICFIYSNTEAAEKKILKIALSINKGTSINLAKELEDNINSTLSQKYKDIYTVVVIPTEGYSKKRDALDENYDLVEGGTGIFIQAKTDSHYNDYEVLMHACYFDSNPETVMFIRGLIIGGTNRKNLNDLSKSKIYAVDPNSASGFLLQKIFLKKKLGLDSKNLEIYFDKSNDKVISMVKNNPDSYGFLPSYVKTDDVNILAKSDENVPSAVILCKKSLDSDLKIELKNKLLFFYADAFRKNKIKHLFIDKLDLDYNRYVKILNDEQDYDKWFISTIIATSILFIMFLFFWKEYKKRKNLEMDKIKNQDIREEFMLGLGVDSIELELFKHSFVFDTEDLVKTIENLCGVNFKSEEAQKTIFDAVHSMTKNIEPMINAMFNALRSSTTLPEKLKIKSNPKNISSKLEVLSSDFFKPLRHMLTESNDYNNKGNPYKDIIEQHPGIEQFIPLANLDSLIEFIWCYRNNASHINSYFFGLSSIHNKQLKYDSEQAIRTLRHSLIHILRCLRDSEILNKRNITS